MLENTSKHDVSKLEKKDVVLVKCAVLTVIFTILQVVIGLMNLYVMFRG